LESRVPVTKHCAPSYNNQTRKRNILSYGQMLDAEKEDIIKTTTTTKQIQLIGKKNKNINCSAENRPIPEPN
jgi:hypothetical protein